MRRGTTPTITITTDVDLTTYDTVILTIRDKNHTQIDIAKDKMTITDTSVCVTLSQEQTLALKEGSIEMQIRAAISGKAIASNIMNGEMNKILRDGVIGYD